MLDKIILEEEKLPKPILNPKFMREATSFLEIALYE